MSADAMSFLKRNWKPPSRAIETRTKAALDEIQEADVEWDKLMSKGQAVTSAPPGSQWDKAKGAWVMPS